ncbi:MAG: hypothetical protein K2X47_16725 [Bdellovibrionales bacterium]|nr:hypothetical protein [Bdellovibrionales bacterium]
MIKGCLPWIFQFVFAFFAFHSWITENIPVLLRNEIVLIEPATDRAQIFWKKFQDAPYLEPESQRFGLVQGSNILIQKLHPSQTNFIRLDPILAEGKVELGPICFSYMGVELECWKPDPIFESQTADPQMEFQLRPRTQKKILALQILAIFMATCLSNLLFFGLHRMNSKSKMISSDLPRTPSRALYRVGFLSFLILPGIGAWILYHAFSTPTLPETAGFTHGKAPVFIEHLFDQQGHPLSDRPGNFAVMMDPFTMFRNFPNQKVFGVTTDKNGFRGSELTTTKKIGLVLGGSAAFGWRLNGDNETLDWALKQASGVHFINMATVSHLVGQELATFLHYGVNFKPRFVISFSGWNDFFENYLGVTRSGFGYNSAFDEYQHRLRRLYELEPRRQTKKPLPNAVPHFGRISPEELAKHYVSSALKIHHLAKTTGADYLLVLQPDLHFKTLKTANESAGMKNWELYIEQKNESFKEQYLKYTKAIEALCGTEGLRVLNLANNSDFVKTPNELFTDTVHLSKDGYLLVSKLILAHQKITP